MEIGTTSKCISSMHTKTRNSSNSSTVRAVPVISQALMHQANFNKAVINKRNSSKHSISRHLLATSMVSHRQHITDSNKSTDTNQSMDTIKNMDTNKNTPRMLVSSGVECEALLFSVFHCAV